MRRRHTVRCWRARRTRRSSGEADDPMDAWLERMDRPMDQFDQRGGVEVVDCRTAVEL